MNLFGWARCFVPSKEQDSLNCLSFGKSKQQLHSLESLTGSNSCSVMSAYPRYQFSRADTKHMQEGKEKWNKSAVAAEREALKWLLGMLGRALAAPK